MEPVNLDTIEQTATTLESLAGQLRRGAAVVRATLSSMALAAVIADMPNSNGNGHDAPVEQPTLHEPEPDIVPSQPVTRGRVTKRGAYRHKTRRAANGTGVSALTKVVLQASSKPLTPTQIWDRVKGKAQSSSKNPRGLINVTLRSLFMDGKVTRNGNAYAWRA